MLINMTIIFSIVSKTGKATIEILTRNFKDSGYHIKSVEGAPYEFNMKNPSKVSADAQWKLLSEEEKDDVRVNGWDHFGQLEHAIAKTMKHLTFNSDDAKFYENRLQSLKKKLDDLYLLLLNSDEDYESLLAQPLDDYRVTRKILYVHNHLKNFDYYFSPEWVVPVN